MRKRRGHGRKGRGKEDRGGREGKGERIKKTSWTRKGLVYINQDRKKARVPGMTEKWVQEK